MTNSKKPGKYWLSLTGIAVQMGVIIFLGAKAGNWLDAKYANENNAYTIILTLVAVAIAMYLVVKQTRKLNP